MTIAESVIAEIMKHMPQGADKYLVSSGGDGFKLCIHWKLNNDPERPNKYSKTIAIQVPRELIEDFPGYPENMQNRGLAKIGTYIQGKLGTFDPNHNSPRGVPEPVEHWTLLVENIFG